MRVGQGHGRHKPGRQAPDTPRPAAVPEGHPSGGHGKNAHARGVPRKTVETRHRRSSCRQSNKDMDQKRSGPRTGTTAPPAPQRIKRRQYHTASDWPKGPTPRAGRPRPTGVAAAATGLTVHGWENWEKRRWMPARTTVVIGRRFHMTCTIQGMHPLLIRNGRLPGPGSAGGGAGQDAATGWGKVGAPPVCQGVRSRAENPRRPYGA